MIVCGMISTRDDRECGALTIVAGALLALLSAALPVAAWGNCTTSGTTVSCDSSAPNPWTTTIGTGPSTASGTTVNLGSNAQVVVGDANAIALGNNASITVSDGGLVKNVAVSTGGLYGTGGNTIELNNNGTLIVQAGATVYAAGPAGNAEAVAAEGVGNTIDNYGTIRADRAAVFFSDTFSGSNTIINEVGGVIQGPSATTDVIGTYASALNFTNMGKVIGSLIFTNGARDQLHLYTGSTITGAIGGGTGGSNLMTLNGAGIDFMSGALSNFQTLIKQDSGAWALTGALGNNSGASPLTVEVQAGTLVLTGNNASFNGTMTVDPAGTLQGTSSTLMPVITDNGLVDFAQPTDGTYAGILSGTGAVAEEGAGVLTLAGANTYSGGTVFNAGTVAISADSNLGASTGSLTFNGGTLQFTDSFDLSTGRPITLNAPGGTIDTQSFATTIAQEIAGAGALTKAGDGQLTLTADNSYTGGTTIAAGTLQVGNGGTSGSILGNVADNGTLTLDRSDVVTFTGVISGVGGVNQIGSGTTVLTADNRYTGGTTIAAGILQVGNGGTSGSVLGDVANSGTLAFDRSDVSTLPGVISGTGGVNQIGSGTTVLGASNSYSGPTIVEVGTLAAGATNAFSPNSAETIEAGATLDLAGFDQFVPGVVNAGTIVTHGDPDTQLIVRGNYAGNGGLLVFDTYLGTDDSPSDKLVIEGGTATGTTSIRINNFGGPGAETLRDGIPVVLAVNGATTDPDAFALAGEVRAGDYSYRLERGGLDGFNAQDWFLRDTFEVGPIEPPIPTPPQQVVPTGEEPVPNPPEPPAETGPVLPTDPLPVDPPPPVLPPGVYPIIGPELATYGVVQPIARQMGVTMLGTLHQRIGDTLTDEYAGPDTEGWGPSSWARFYGQQINNRYQAFADPSATGRLLGVQAGFDIWRGSFIPGHRDVAGVYFAYGNSAADVNGLITNAAATGYVFARTGTVNLYGYSGGAY